MVRIVFKKQVHSGFSAMSSNDVYLHHLVELDFLPLIGMEVIDGEWSATVLSLTCKDGIVFAWTYEDKELYEAALSPDPRQKARSIDEVVSDWVAEGWSVSEGVLSL
jgi:hypothetical protein